MAKNILYDKYYTKKDVAKQCIATIDLKKYKTIIEPSAGAGAFSDLIPNCIAYDIKPEKTGIIEQDFLTLDLTQFEKPILFIGNPPFGRQSSLAVNFIRQAAIVAETIAFILPKSFKKESMKDKVPLNFKLSKEVDLLEEAFEVDGKDVSIPCIFQVWELSPSKRNKSEKLEPTSFQFVKKEDADLAIRRVGVYAGKAYVDFEKKSESSHYFIHTLNEAPLIFTVIVNDIEWEHDNTVGPRSISKNELVVGIEDALMRYKGH